jgi:ABC transport system ATP-binding/permease protein
MMKMTTASTDVTKGNRAVMTEPAQNDAQKVPGMKGVLLQAKELTIHTRAGVSLLSDISFHVEPGELIALTGLSHSGKSTLLQSLAGLLKPASGEVLIDGINLYTNLRAFRSSIGFVPADYALQQNLTVTEILQEAARLRLPRRASSRDREQRVLALLESVGLTQVTDHRVGSLSSGEKRRLSIAVELMGYPGLLLLDEPTEQLTPFEQVQITTLLRELSRGGLTVIQADQRSRSAGLSDKIIFLAPGGLLAWFGPADEAFTYLRGFVPRGIVKDLFALKEALEILANPQAREGVEWAKQFKAHAAYQKYVEDPLDNRYPDLMLQTHPLIRIRLRNSSQEKLPPAIIPRANTAQKLILLIRRNFRLLWRDKTLFSMLAIPLLIALVDFGLSSTTVLDSERAPIIFGLLVFLILLTSTSLVQNEIFKERAVYQRENRTSSLAFPYILSKVWLVGMLAVYQGLVWAIIHFAATGLTGGFQVLSADATTFFLVAFIGGILGLIVSAFSRTIVTSTNWVLLLTVPQLLLSQAVIPTGKLIFPFNFLSRLNPSRYALETLLATSAYGQGLNVNLFSDWSILVIMSLGLVVLLVGIQQGAGKGRT